MKTTACAVVCREAHALGLPVHLDGARIFNASIALSESVAELTHNCDSVMFTLSKGLGAPAGSMLLGSREFIEEARIWRKRFGGGMRQVGILAAAGLIALEDGPKRLHEDHANARRLAEGVAEIPGVQINLDSVVTNIVIFDVSGTGKTTAEISQALRQDGIIALGISETQMRMVTHLDVNNDDITATLSALRKALRR
jgi:threonine aldolase